MNLVDALVLKSLPRVGDGSVINLLKFSLIQNIETLEELSEIDSSKLPLRGIPPALKKLFETGDFQTARERIQYDIKVWRTKNIKVTVLGSEEYPKQLLELDNPPPFLFYKGNSNLLKRALAVAVVGTRNNTLIGEKITIRTVEEFAKFGFPIVSGLALGIDAIAHQAAINANTPTIAVLVDLINIAPLSNRPLADEILKKGGLWVSENPPGTKIIPAFFAKRDRIQAGLSAGVFAIETAVDGGTMHAVNTALSMSRPVFVPDANAAGYPDLGIKAIAGTQQLVNENKAESYTRESYKEIRGQLEKIYTKFESNIAEGLPL
jgi:DNA processing protein